MLYSCNIILLYYYSRQANLISNIILLYDYSRQANLIEKNGIAAVSNLFFIVLLFKNRALCTVLSEITLKLEMMFMRHYAPTTVCLSRYPNLQKSIYPTKLQCQSFCLDYKFSDSKSAKGDISGKYNHFFFLQIFTR